MPGENIQTVFEASVTIPKNRKKQEDFIKQIVHEVLVNPVMARDQSPKQQRDDSRDRLDALRSEQRRDKFNKNRPLSQEIFSPTQNMSQSQTQSSTPLTQPSPAKVNPFQKSAEDRTAFLRATSRSPSTDRLQVPFTNRGREREKRRERERASRSPSSDKPDIRNDRSQIFLQNSSQSSQSYVTPGQRSDHSREREKRTEKDSRVHRQSYDSGADRIKLQDRYFNIRYTPPRDARNASRNRSLYNQNYPSSRQRQYSQERSHYRNERNNSLDRHVRNNSPYHNYGRNRSPSPYAYPPRRNASYD